VQSQVLDLRRDRSASLFTRTSYQCEDGRAPAPDSSRYAGTYTASADSVIVLFPSSSGADSIAWRMSRAGNRLIYSLGAVYTPGGIPTDTFRLIYQRR